MGMKNRCSFLKQLLTWLSALGLLACVAVVFSTLAVGWTSFRIIDFVIKELQPEEGSSAEIVKIVKELKYKPLLIFDSGVLVARPPREYLIGNLDGVPTCDIETLLKSKATLELQYKAKSEYSVDFTKAHDVFYGRKKGRIVLIMELPQPIMEHVRWLNEADSTKWDQIDGSDKRWRKFLNQTYNRQLFVSAAVRQNYDNEKYRDMARKQTEKFIRILFGSLVSSPEKDIIIHWKPN